MSYPIFYPKDYVVIAKLRIMLTEHLLRLSLIQMAKSNSPATSNRADIGIKRMM
jgi:hypothetical protein